MDKLSFLYIAINQSGSLIDFFRFDFMPHGHCYAWSPGILWSTVLSDTVIFLAYASIPVSLLYFVRQRQDIKYSWVFLLFGLFIFACGLTHLMSIVTTWQGVYGLAAIVKFFTAVVSIGTAITLWRQMPVYLNLPTPKQLESLNESLEKRVAERTEALEKRSSELQMANEELRQFNKLAVGREQRVIELKKEINRLYEEAGKPSPYRLDFEQNSMLKTQFES